ncbi:MAG: alpha-L-fucosidase, partial [Sedimentisphaerales bacterium]
KNDRPWTEQPPAMNPAFTEKWFLRCKDLVDKYQPDLLYFDNIGELPLDKAGLDITAHYYNASLKRHSGKLEAVANCKGLSKKRRNAVVEDIERGVATDILPEPWQTDTCIGSWHYSRDIAEKNKYKTVQYVIHLLIDVVSKNGNLLLSIPIRGDGTIDEHEVAFLEGMAKWMNINSEAIFNTRPWKVFGEGPTKVKTGMFSESETQPYTARDIRFTRSKDDKILYAIVLVWPDDGKVIIRSLANSAGNVTGVSLLGHKKHLSWKQTENGLEIQFPPKAPCQFAYCLKVTGGPFTPAKQ